MILKKPYAFLIKYFRIIHLLLAIPAIYLLYKSTNIVTFFNDYVRNNYSLTINGDLSNIFINSLMYLSIVLIVLSIIAVYWLFKYKKKPRKNYIIIIIYYLLLFILLNVSYNILNVMETEVIEASLARSYRDISLLLVLPQFYFVVFIVLRGLGFNIKKLNFADDLKELEITEKDSEEFEFVVGIDSYKAKRTIRRFIREFTYYIKENTFIVIAIALLAIISISTSVYLNREQYELKYKIGETFGYQNFSISIEDTILTNLAYNGSIINKDKYYLILKLKVKNNLNEPKELKYTDFRIKLNNEYLYPIINKSSYFADYATPYDGKKIKASSEESYALVYEIDKENLKEKYNLKIYNGVSTKKDEIKTRYSNILLTPLLIDEKSEVTMVNLKEQLDLTNSNIGNTHITVNSYQLTNKYIYNYERCYANKCNTYTDYVSVDYLNTGTGSTLLILDYNLLLDMNSRYSNYIKNEKTFFNNFASIRYKIGEMQHTASVINRTPNNLNNTLILQVSNQINNADELYFLITVRNKIYGVKLK